MEALEKYLYVGAFSPENPRLSGMVWHCWKQEPGCRHPRSAEGDRRAPRATLTVVLPRRSALGGPWGTAGTHSGAESAPAVTPAVHVWPVRSWRRQILRPQFYTTEPHCRLLVLF